MSDPSSVEKAHIWLNDMAAEMGTEDHNEAYRVFDEFRAILPEDLRPILG